MLRSISYCTIPLALTAAIGCTQASSDSPSGASAIAPDPAAPVLLSAGTNVTTITRGESVLFTAVVTDPDGIEDLIGGSLTSEDGTAQYGALATTDQEGAYSLSLSWDAINQVKPISFLQQATRVFNMTFFDVAGHSAIKPISVGLTCNGIAACTGSCTRSCTTVTLRVESCTDACGRKELDCVASGNVAKYTVNNGGNPPFTVNLATCATVPSPTASSGPAVFPFQEVDCSCTPRS